MERPYLASVRLINMQSIKDYTFEFPATGVVRFNGPNSNGKSVLSKAMAKVVRELLNQKDQRIALVNWDCAEGCFIATRSDGMELYVNIAIEASNTYYKLTTPGHEPLIRGVSTEKGVGELVRMFGFHYNSNRDFSLNFYETYGQLLFVNTPRMMNGEIINEVITDPNSENALALLSGQLQTFKDAIKAIANDEAMIDLKMGSMTFCDEEATQSKVNRLQFLKKNLSALPSLVIPQVEYIPTLDNLLTISVDELKRELESIQVVLPSNTNNLIKLPDIKVIDDITHDWLAEFATWTDSVIKEECPTCQRKAIL